MSAKLPVVAIVGRPNVGKSTLFNRIVGRRVAVVEDSPGVTRDRLYASAEWRGRRFTVVDTGGILFGDDDPLIEQVRVQAEVAMAEADVVLFLVDCVGGLSTGDMELANRLRGWDRPVLIVANKADNPKRAALSSEFYELALGEVLPLSGLHGRGVADALDQIVALLPPETEEPEATGELRLAIVGRPNVGKSSLLNAFTGEKRAIVSDIPGTTRDAIDTVIERDGQRYRLIDTAGIRRKGKIQGTVEYYMALRATAAIERADCAIVVIDGKEGLADGDKRIAKIAHDFGRAMVVVVNKWDEVEPPDGRPRRQSEAKRGFLKVIRNEHPEIAYAQVCFTSATMSAGLEPVLDHAASAVESWSFRISTGALNRLIQDAAFERPYTSKGRLLKIYYSTQVSARPPAFVLFCNDVELMHFSYKRYLENRIRSEYPLLGTPIRVLPRARAERDR
jgi:GTP-binding protein